MKKIVLYLFMWLPFAGLAQTIPYVGGNGSGYLYSNSPILQCNLFNGGIGDGMGLGIGLSTFCSIYSGELADGYSSALSAPLPCSHFLGGIGDGYMLSNSSFVVCQSFFGGSGDGYAVDTFKFCQVLLPVKLLHFRGVKEVGYNMLYWQVANLHDAKAFEVQRSAAGGDFVSIGSVAAGVSQYSFVDNTPLTPYSYYRLRIVEKDGHFFYSDIIVLGAVSKTIFSVFPNPAHNYTTIICNSPKATTAYITVYGANGQLLFKQGITLQRGNNNFTANISNLGAGLYIISIDELGVNQKLAVQ
jgi:hypothetical protein